MRPCSAEVLEAGSRALALAPHLPACGVEERIDRLGGPIGDGDAVACGPDFDLAKAFSDERVAQIFAQRLSS
jgi:hypothetical protein